MNRRPGESGSVDELILVEEKEGKAKHQVVFRGMVERAVPGEEMELVRGGQDDFVPGSEAVQVEGQLAFPVALGGE